MFENLNIKNTPILTFLKFKIYLYTKLEKGFQKKPVVALQIAQYSY